MVFTAVVVMLLRVAIAITIVTVALLHRPIILIAVALTVNRKAHQVAVMTTTSQIHQAVKPIRIMMTTMMTIKTL